MDRKFYPLGAAVVASTVAGPIFVIVAAFAETILLVPQPIGVSADEAAAFFVILLTAEIVGFFLAIVPNLIGTSLLSGAAGHNQTARMPETWVGAGAASGALLAAAVGAAGITAFALIATSASCAAICRALVRLD